MIVGTTIILVLYALLPESFRFSRALILLGTGWGVISLPLIRLVLHIFKIPWIQLGEKQSQRFLVIGEKEEAIRVSKLLESAYVKPAYIGLVSVSEKLIKDKDFVGNINQVNDIITIYKIDEVIFCSKNIPHHMIIDKMTEWQHLEVDYKIAPEDSLSIIGSNSIHTRGDLYTVNINAVDKTANRRNKRLLDISLSCLLLLLSPIVIFFQKQPGGFIKNLFVVLFGLKSWVGYCPVQNETVHLPNIRKGVLNPSNAMKFRDIDAETAVDLNILYARDYNIWKDMNIVIYAFRELGR
jgi:uncharacterized protein YihD (DUF1040 family)